MRLVPLRDDGTPDIDSLNAEFTADYLADKRNPRWVAKPTVAYLWARTVTCKNCRATMPLLKTRWLCKKDQQAGPADDGANDRPIWRDLWHRTRDSESRAATLRKARARQTHRRRHNVPIRGEVPLLLRRS